MNERPDLRPEIQALVERARAAQRAIEHYMQEQPDRESSHWPV